MKIGSFRINGEPTFAAVSGDGLVDLGSRLKGRCTSLAELLATPSGLDTAQELTQRHAPDISLAEVEFLPVIPNPGKIFCIGVNYADHLQETRIRKSSHPTVFLRYPESQTAHRQPLLLPKESQQLDYEGEVAIIIGKTGRRITPENAWSHIAGYACYNDGSVRDWQLHSTQWSPGKNFDSTGSFGPWMVTADVLDPREAPLELTTRVNGEVLQHSDTSLLLFSIPELISYCSTMLPLNPGDVIVTGTPGGVGMARTPPRYLAVGDTVEVEVHGIGTLTNRVEAG